MNSYNYLRNINYEELDEKSSFLVNAEEVEKKINNFNQQEKQLKALKDKTIFLKNWLKDYPYEFRYEQEYVNPENAYYYYTFNPNPMLPRKNTGLGLISNCSPDPMLFFKKEVI